jgi:hypothetical protein
MTTSLQLGVACVVALALGAAIGAGWTSARDAAAVAAAEQRAAKDAESAEDLRRRIDALRSDYDKLRRELDGLRRAPTRPREPAAPPEPAVAVGTGEDAGRVGMTAKNDDDARRLVAAARAAIERRDGRAALTAVRALAGIVPEGRADAMELVVELEDMDRLQVSDVAWGAFLGCPEVVELLGWSLGRPSPEAFREIAAEALPSLAPPEVAIAKFSEVLRTESDEDVRRSMVEGLIALHSSGADVVLGQLFADVQVAIPVRVQIATHLSTSDDAKALESLRAAADGAPPVLAAGIRAALAGRDATENGFLVTGFVTGAAEGHGLEVGDVVVRYDGSLAAMGLDGAIRKALDRGAPVQVEVLRGAARQTLDLQPGWLGLIGRVVEARRDRR